jgi:hypothetical protein
MVNKASRTSWLRAYERFYQALPDDGHVLCPNCGHDTLRAVFVGDRSGSDGYAFFWCDCCRNGLWLSTVPIPPGVEVQPRGMSPEEFALKVPQFNFVLPE